MKKDNMRKSIIQILTSLRDDKPAGLLGEIAGISESDIAAKYRTKYVNELIGCLIRADMVNGETTSTKGDGSGKPTSFTNLEITLSGFLLLQRLQDEEEKGRLARSNERF